eukprot:TRINITY_DN13923_c0_g1_i2.p2 TRINITY_DN13923_c0_g1~~TRINITY_DN13923_c0_g1_i2.p2  ORF type:complete len:209 (-),score=25.51 TRINITY_DN13923_c0_g1_i2:51-677(-)
MCIRDRGTAVLPLLLKIQQGGERMSWEYSENILVQNSAGNLLQNELDWDVQFAYNAEVLGEDGTFGRKSYKEIVLTRYLRRALLDNNDWSSDEHCDTAVKTLIAHTSTNTLMQTNREKYGMLREGIPIKVKKPNGDEEHRLVRVFNFSDPEKNHFLAVKEMKIHGDLYRRRTDIVGLSLIHISEPTRPLYISYAVFCLKKKKNTHRLI